MVNALGKGLHETEVQHRTLDGLPKVLFLLHFSLLYKEGNGLLNKNQLFERILPCTFGYEKLSSLVA